MFDSFKPLLPPVYINRSFPPRFLSLPSFILTSFNLQQLSPSPFNLQQLSLLMSTQVICHPSTSLISLSLTSLLLWRLTAASPPKPEPSAKSFASQKAPYRLAQATLLLLLLKCLIPNLSKTLTLACTELKCPVRLVRNSGAFEELKTASFSSTNPSHRFASGQEEKKTPSSKMGTITKWLDLLAFKQ